MTTRPTNRPTTRRALLSAITLAAALALPPAAADDAALERILSAVVGLRARVPSSARTAASIGTDRVGSGIVIDSQGLILTVGYLILEAEAVTVTPRPGEAPSIPARVLAYDHETGLGLVRAGEALDVAPMPLADSDATRPGAPLMIASYGGLDAARPSLLVDRREFAGYWEYLLTDALFVSPPHPRFGGAALVDADGALVGVGALVVNDARRGPQPLPGNVFIPVNLLKSVLGELLTSGRGPGPRRPWLGLYTEELDGRLVVRRVAPDGPAERAGIVPGTLVDAVHGQRVSGMADFYRKLWSAGAPGQTLTLTLLAPDGRVADVEVVAGDRYEWLRLP